MGLPSQWACHPDQAVPICGRPRASWCMSYRPLPPPPTSFHAPGGCGKWGRSSYPMYLDRRTATSQLCRAAAVAVDCLTCCWSAVPDAVAQPPLSLTVHSLPCTLSDAPMLPSIRACSPPPTPAICNPSRPLSTPLTMTTFVSPALPLTRAATGVAAPPVGASPRTHRRAFCPSAPVRPRRARAASVAAAPSAVYQTGLGGGPPLPDSPPRMVTVTVEEKGGQGRQDYPAASVDRR